MNSITERWIGSCRHELLDRTLIWNLRHLMMVLREYEDFYNSRRPDRALDQATLLGPCQIVFIEHGTRRSQPADERGGPG